jgi:hypothetical protein
MLRHQPVGACQAPLARSNGLRELRELRELRGQESRARALK